MKKFKFRLQKVLEYRELNASWARDAYIAARAARLRCERELEAIRLRQTTLAEAGADTIEDRRALESCLRLLEDEERMQTIVLSDLESDEAGALKEWLQKRQELEALQKLREREYGQWRADSDRAEQKELDDWGVRAKAA